MSVYEDHLQNGQLTPYWILQEAAGNKGEKDKLQPLRSLPQLLERPLGERKKRVKGRKGKGVGKQLKGVREDPMDSKRGRSRRGSWMPKKIT